MKAEKDVRVAVPIIRLGGKVCVVQNGNLHTFPTEKYERKDGPSLFKTALRGIKEEFCNIDIREFFFEMWLGTHIKVDSEKGKDFLFEFFLFRIKRKTAKHLIFSEGHHEFIDPRSVKENIDDVGRAGLEKLSSISRSHFLPVKVARIFMGKKRRVRCQKQNLKQLPENEVNEVKT